MLRSGFTASDDFDFSETGGATGDGGQLDADDSSKHVGKGHVRSRL